MGCSGRSIPEVVAKPEITVVFTPDGSELSQLHSLTSRGRLALRPYLVTKAQRGIVGTSRYAVRLRQQIRKPLLTASQS